MTGSVSPKQEIERKFLVKKQFMHVIPTLPHKAIIRQGYLSKVPERTVRVRTCISAVDKAYMTIKGLTQGCSRPEYEYEIPFGDATYLIENLCLKPVISKIRYQIIVGRALFEVDVFQDRDLCLAEIELDSEDEEFPRPDWLGEEVTGNPKYYNSNL